MSDTLNWHLWCNCALSLGFSIVKPLV